jgi:hypothetical protein
MITDPGRVYQNRNTKSQIDSGCQKNFIESQINSNTKGIPDSDYKRQ